MKKTIIITLIFAFAFALSSSLAFAAPAEKVEICHTTDSFDVLANGWTVVVGHVIEVSENSLPAHLAHGDFNGVEGFMLENVVGGVFGSMTWGTLAINVGLNLAGAECAGFVADF